MKYLIIILLFLYPLKLNANIKDEIKIKLENTNNIVIGIARSRTIQHERYQHHYIDLSKPWTEKIFKSKSFTASKVVLINNAGSIGPIKSLSLQDEEEISENYFLKEINL